MVVLVGLVPLAIRKGEAGTSNARARHTVWGVLKESISGKVEKAHFVMKRGPAERESGNVALVLGECHTN